MRRLRTAFSLFAAGFALVACSGGNGERQVGPFNQLADAARATYQEARRGPPQPVVVTRALLDQTPGEVLQAIPDNSGLQDFLRLVARRTDDGPGTIEVWQSSDNAQVILRDGVLVGTRGLSGDMRSAEAGAALAGFDGTGGGGARRITLSRTDGASQTMEFACEMTQLGTETLQIVDRQYRTHRIQETCVFRDLAFTNDYWIDVGAPRMRKSRQWVGPYFGYVAFERLKR